MLVEVLDSNDHSPVLSEPLYAATVPEDASPGTSVLRLRCSDKDHPEPGENRSHECNGKLLYVLYKRKYSLVNTLNIDLYHERTGKLLNVLHRRKYLLVNTLNIDLYHERSNYLMFYIDENTHLLILLILTYITSVQIT